MSQRTWKLAFTLFLSLAAGLSGLLPSVRALAQQGSNRPVAKTVPVDQATVRMWDRYGHECSEGVFPLHPENGCSGINYEKAVEWYAKAAKQGSTDAQTNLGFAYEQGQGVKQDYEKAVYWYTKAAEQGYALAQYNLSLHYYKGLGVKKDYEKSAEWAAKAAKQGNILAESQLGYRYDKGLGVTQDYTTAYYWYEQAANGRGTGGEDVNAAALAAANRAGLIYPQVDSQRLAVLMRAQQRKQAETKFEAQQAVCENRKKEYLKLPSNPLRDAECMWPESHGPRTPAEQANLDKVVRALHGVYLGESQAKVKAQIQSQLPGWVCPDAGWNGDEWVVGCMVKIADNGPGNRIYIPFGIAMHFSVFKRVQVMDPDTHLTDSHDQKTDRLLELTVPGCSDWTGTVQDKCDSPLETR